MQCIPYIHYIHSIVSIVNIVNVVNVVGIVNMANGVDIVNVVNMVNAAVARARKCTARKRVARLQSPQMEPCSTKVTIFTTLTIGARAARAPALPCSTL